MLRNLAFGERDFVKDPVEAITRTNWEFMASLNEPLGPLLAAAPPPPMRARCLWLFPPATPHGWRSSGPVQRTMFQFDFIPEPLSAYAVRNAWHECPLTRGDALELRRLAVFLQPYFENAGPTSGIHFQHALYRITQIAIGNIPLHALPRPDDIAVHTVEKTVAWFTEHMHEKPSLAVIARKVGTSPSHLRRLFWQVRKSSPHSVFMNMRIQRAMEMISATANKLENIAEASGFGSAADFSRAFKRCKGISPSGWRKRVSA